MHWNTIETNWEEFEGAARAHWPKLVDADWQAIKGKKSFLIARIHRRYEITLQEAESQVDIWTRGLMDLTHTSKPNDFTYTAKPSGT
jgi:uncharacterized protein YjbJ (UPF0337 family)